MSNDILYSNIGAVVMICVMVVIHTSIFCTNTDVSTTIYAVHSVSSCTTTVPIPIPIQYDAANKYEYQILQNNYR